MYIIRSAITRKIEQVVMRTAGDTRLHSEVLRIWQRISAGSCKAISGGGGDDDSPMKMSKGPCHSDGHGTYLVACLLRHPTIGFFDDSPEILQKQKFLPQPVMH